MFEALHGVDSRKQLLLVNLRVQPCKMRWLWAFSWRRAEYTVRNVETTAALFRANTSYMVVPASLLVKITSCTKILSAENGDCKRGIPQIHEFGPCTCTVMTGIDLVFPIPKFWRNWHRWQTGNFIIVFYSRVIRESKQLLHWPGPIHRAVKQKKNCLPEKFA